MLVLRRGGCGCSRRGLSNPTAVSMQRPQPQEWLPRLRLLSSGRGKPPAPPPEVDAEERAAWRSQFKRPGHHHHSHNKKPAPVLAALDPAGIAVDGEGEGGVRAFEGASYELRFGDHVLVMGGNGAGKSLFWQALGGKRGLGGKDGKKKTGGGDDVGGTKALMYMSFNMHERFLEQHGQRVVADVLGGTSDPLARRLIVTLGLYPLWYVICAILSGRVVVWLLHLLSYALPSLSLNQVQEGRLAQHGGGSPCAACCRALQGPARRRARQALRRPRRPQPRESPHDPLPALPGVPPPPR